MTVPLLCSGSKCPQSKGIYAINILKTSPQVIAMNNGRTEMIERILGKNIQG
jgi:hypothetical protein